MIPKRDNYAIQAEEARLRFLTYDQSAMPAQKDGEYLYLRFCGFPYRICRADGHLFRRVGERWHPADSHGEVLTIYDYLCDARPGRAPARKAVSMAFLGGHVHTGLAAASGSLERAIDRAPADFRRACLALGGRESEGGDLCFELDLFEDLPVRLRFWHADEDFPPSLDLLWDANTLQFLRYETTWFAAGVLRSRLRETMAL